MKDSESLKSIEMKEKIRTQEKISKLFDDDSDTEYEYEENKKKGDLNHFMLNGISNMNLKISILLLFLFIILNSEVFIDNILTKFEGTLVDGKTTNKGVFISSLFLAVGYIIIDMVF